MALAFGSSQLPSSTKLAAPDIGSRGVGNLSLDTCHTFLLMILFSACQSVNRCKRAVAVFPVRISQGRNRQLMAGNNSRTSQTVIAYKKSDNSRRENVLQGKQDMSLILPAGLHLRDVVAQKPCRRHDLERLEPSIVTIPHTSRSCTATHIRNEAKSRPEHESSTEHKVPVPKTLERLFQHGHNSVPS